MNKQEMCLLWNILAATEKSSDDEKRILSYGLNRYAGQLNVPRIDILPARKNSPETASSVAPSFQNLNGQIMAWMRHELLYDGKTNDVEAWAEKLMRFCEVRRPILRKKALEKWDTSGNASSNMRRLAVFFLDYYLTTGDYRFLNTALKLGDMKWILDKSITQKTGCASGEPKLDELLQAKIYLVLHCEINRLSAGPDKQEKSQA